MTEADAEKLLRSVALRVTRPRIAVLSVIHEEPHRDVAVIVDRVRKRIGSVSTQTVYGVLDVLVKAHLARRIDLPGLPALYEGGTRDAHQHAVCRECGRIIDVIPAGNGAVAATPDDVGFAVEEIDVTFWGLCPECQATGLRTGAGPD